METRRLGNTDMHVSVLGFGGSEIGYEQISASAAGKLLQDALDAGVNVFDTAECYVTSEDLIGKAISRRRADYYLFTKCGHERGWSHPDWRSESLWRSVERSLNG
jgi:aryl-alcohol dehydrogenase-like predicted oxidoreductase